MRSWRSRRGVLFGSLLFLAGAGLIMAGRQDTSAAGSFRYVIGNIAADSAPGPSATPTPGTRTPTATPAASSTPSPGQSPSPSPTSTVVVPPTLAPTATATPRPTTTLTPPTGTFPSISGSPTSPAPVGQPYSYSFAVAGTAPVSVSVTGGTLPPGITLSGNQLSGTPTTPGTYTATITANNSAGSASRTVTIVIVPVNQAPSFVAGPDQVVLEDAPAQDVAGWATAISPGGPGESGQVLTFTVTNDNNALFSAQPAVSPSGTLSYTPAPNASGVANVTVVLKDDGGTALGGADTSAPQTFTITVDPAIPDLTLTKGDGGATVTPGGTITYTLSYANAGTADASGVTLTETVPADTSFLAGSSTAGWICAPDANAGSTCTLSVGAVPAGSNASATFAVMVAAAPGALVVSNTASIADDGSEGADPVPGNNNASDTTTVLAPQLTLAKSASAPTFTVGIPASYLLTLTNTGTAATTAVSIITDVFPSGLSIGTLPAGCTATGQTVRCTVADGLAPTASVSFTIPVTPTLLAIPSVNHIASVTGGGDPTCPNHARCVSTAGPTPVMVPQLTLTKTASAASFVVNVPASYSLALSNTGTAATTAEALITDTIPSGLTIGTLPAGCTPAGQTVTCTVAAGLAATASVSFTIPVTPTAAAAPSVSNNASVTGGGDPTCPTDARCTSTAGPTPISTAPVVAIHDVQGNGLTSPLNGASVTLSGIVTAQKFNNGFFLQTPDAQVDADPQTSEGIFVFTSSAPPATATVGNRVLVTGTVTEFTPSSDPNQLSITEIVSVTSIQVLSTGNPLPAPVVLTTSDFSAPSTPGTAEGYEGMRVTITSATVVGPAEGTIAESSATAATTGVFHVVLGGVGRPFREPGIGIFDLFPIPGGKTPPRFDTNQERIMIRSRGQVGASAVTADAGASVDSATGVLDYFAGTWALLPDPAVLAVSGGATPTAVDVATADEVTIASFNLGRFFDEVNDANGAPTLTAAALDKRLTKASLAICDYLKAPHILGVQEVENLRVLGLLADRINATCAAAPQYVPYLVQGNDVGGINVGFLVSNRAVGSSSRVEVLDVTQEGKNTLFLNPDASTSLLNDRPPLRLRANVHLDNGAAYPVTVIVNHLRSMNGIDDTGPGSNGWPTEGDRIRAKRKEQALFLANLVQSRQAADPAEHIVVIGDFNAYEFNDGYVDVMGIIRGAAAADPEVITFTASPVTPAFTIGTSLITDALQRYSFVLEGNAQALDHLLVNSPIVSGATGLEVQFARINADFSAHNYGTAGTAIRTSDHDPLRISIGVPPPVP